MRGRVPLSGRPFFRPVTRAKAPGLFSEATAWLTVCHVMDGRTLRAFPFALQLLRRAFIRILTGNLLLPLTFSSDYNEMKTHPIPRTNLTASVLCLGTAEFGSAVDEASSEKIIETYLDAGGNVLDTAEIYAAWLPNGEHRSETFLGEWLRKHKNRDRLIISSKGAHPRLDSMDKARMSKSVVESDLNSSLERLGIDCVDIYWLHRDDPGTPVEEIVQMLEDFRKAGKIRYSGLSNWTQPRAEAARLAAEKLGVESFVGIQNQWSLAKADAAKGDKTWAYTDAPFATWHAAHNIAAFPYTPQGNGYFRRLENGTLEQAPELVRALFHSPENEERYKRIKTLQSTTGLNVGTIVLSYLLSQPFPVFPIVGPKKSADLLESIEATKAALSAEDLAFLVG
jgi:aryl-alcohol dehydrogenase-like predicted oxidoreductase